MKKLFITHLILLLMAPLFLSSQTSTIAGGAYHTIALCESGMVYTWGDNANLQLGRDEDLTHDPNPGQMPIEILPKIRAVAAGGLNSAALACDGTVWTWGRNDNCQLGNGKTTDDDGNECSFGLNGRPGNCDSYEPVQVVGGETGDRFLENIEQITVGLATMYALTVDGRVLAWGRNTHGQLGNGSDVKKSASPVYVKNPDNTGDLSNVIAISATDYGCYALVDEDGDGVGTVYGWGDNSNKQFGSSAIHMKLPVVIPASLGGVLDNITAIDAGSVGGVFVDVKGYVWGIGFTWSAATHHWGDEPYDIYNGYGAERIYAGATESEGFTDGKYLKNVKKAVAAQAHFLAIVEHNNETYALAWGANRLDPWKGVAAAGQLGNGSDVSTSVPDFVMNSDGTDYLKGVVDISSGDLTSYFRVFEETGEINTYICGGNYFGQVGDGTTDNALLPVLFNEPECNIQDVEPFAELGPPVIEISEKKLNESPVFLYAGSVGRNIYYEWEIQKADGTKLTEEEIKELYIDDKGSRIQIDFYGKVRVYVVNEAPFMPYACNDWEWKYTDEIEIKPLTLTGSITHSSFCDDQAIVEISTETEKKYVFYTDEVGENIISTVSSTGTDVKATFSTEELTMSQVETENGMVNFYDVWMNEMVQKDTLVLGTNNFEGFELQTDGSFFQSFSLKKSEVVVHSATIDIADGNDIGKTITPVLYDLSTGMSIAPYISSSVMYANEPPIVAEGDPFVISQKSGNIIPLNFTLKEHDGYNAVYMVKFIENENISFRNQIRNGDGLEAGDASLKFLPLSSSNDTAWYGPAYNWDVSVKKYSLEKPTLISITEDCDRRLSLPVAVTAEKVCQNVDLELAVSYENWDNANQLYDVFWLKGDVSGENIGSISLDDAFATQFEVSNSDLIQNQTLTDGYMGKVTVFIRDAEFPDSTELWSFNTVDIERHPEVLFGIAGKQEYCSGEAIDQITFHAQGKLPFTFSYVINGEMQEDLLCETETTSLPIEKSEAGLYQIGYAEVIDANGCKGPLPESYFEFEIHESVELEQVKNDSVCLVEGTKIDLSEFINIKAVNGEGIVFIKQTASNITVFDNGIVPVENLQEGTNTFIAVYKPRNGCGAELTFEIEAVKAPSVSIAVYDEKQNIVSADENGVYQYCLGSVWSIDGGADDVEHTWSNVDVLSSTDADVVHFQVNNNTDESFVIDYVATGQNGCSADKSITIAVNNPAQVSVNEFPLILSDEAAVELVPYFQTNIPAELDFTQGADITKNAVDASEYEFYREKTLSGLVKATTEWGCVSEYDFEVKIAHPAVYTPFEDVACDEYMFDGQTITESGEYTAQFIAENGADSIVTVDLTINKSVAVTKSKTVAYGTQYQFGAQVLTESGKYTESFETVNGCDSAVALEFTVLPESENRVVALETEEEQVEFTEDVQNNEIVMDLPITDKNGNAVLYELEENDYLLIVDNQIVVKDADKLNATNDEQIDLTLKLVTGEGTDEIIIFIRNEKESKLLGSNLEQDSFKIETAENGATLIDVNVEGVDDEGLTYSLNTNQTAFAIDEQTGVITITDNSMIDFDALAETGLEVIVSDGVTTLTQNITVDLSGYNVTAIDSLAKVKVYPTIVKDYVMVDFPFSNASITIVSVTGTIVYSGEIVSEQPINLTYLSKGTYHVDIKTENGEGVEEVIIKE